MKTLLLALSAFLVSCSSLETQHRAQPEVRDVPFAARPADGEIRKRLFVLPFLDGSPRKSESAAQAARQALLESLARSGQFILINPRDVSDVERFRGPHEYDLSAVAKELNSSGASAVVEGKILQINARKVGDEVGLMRSLRARVEAQVRLRVWGVRNDKELLNDVRQAQIETTTTRIASPTNADRDLQDDPTLAEAVVAKAFDGLVGDLARSLQKLTWEGRIAVVKGEKIYLNAGRMSGLQVGDILRVMGQSEEVYDPETGALIGRVPGHLKGTLEISSYFGQDGSVAVIHSGSGFRENDRVELY